MSCNKTDFDIDDELLGVNKEVKLWLSDSVCGDIDGLITAGGGASAIYGVLVEEGVIAASALSGPIAAVVGGIILTYWGLVKIQNNGCGVVVEMNINPIAPVTATPVVYPQ